jgi:hypothetical protein
MRGLVGVARIFCVKRNRWRAWLPLTQSDLSLRLPNLSDGPTAARPDSPSVVGGGETVRRWPRAFGRFCARKLGRVGTIIEIRNRDLLRSP